MAETAVILSLESAKGKLKQNGFPFAGLPNQFAILKGLPSLIETTDESFCTEIFHWAFAWYLVLEYKSSRNEAYLMRGTVLLYMGCIMTIGQDRLFRGNPFFKDLETPGSWYTKMRCGIERKIISRSIHHPMTTLIPSNDPNGSTLLKMHTGALMEEKILQIRLQQLAAMFLVKLLKRI